MSPLGSGSGSADSARATWFLTAVSDVEGARQARLAIESLRTYGGAWRRSPAYVFVEESAAPDLAAIERLCALKAKEGDLDAHAGLSIRTINRLFMLTLPAHLQLNHGRSLGTTDRDALRAKIIREALHHPS